MSDLKNYRLGFDPWGLGLFLLIMMPNFVWFAVPAPNDILRAESVTPVIDMFAQVLQTITVAALCGVANITQGRPKRGYQISIAVCVGLYFTGWAIYYTGITSAIIILDLCLAPCGALLLYALTRKNITAVISAGGFTLCHLFYGIVNFIP